MGAIPTRTISDDGYWDVLRQARGASAFGITVRKFSGRKDTDSACGIGVPTRRHVPTRRDDCPGLLMRTGTSSPAANHRNPKSLFWSAKIYTIFWRQTHPRL